MVLTNLRRIRMSASIRKIINQRLQIVKETEENHLKDKDHLEGHLLKNKGKLDLIVEEKKELESFLSEYPL